MERIKGAMFFTAAFALAGSSVVAARFAGRALGPYTIAAMSLLFALPVLLMMSRENLLALIKGLSRRGWLMALLQAAFGIFLFRLFLLNGVPHTSTAEAGILTGVTPAATALLAGLLLREPISRARVAGIACTVAGVLLIQGLLLPGAKFSSEHLLGNLLVLLAALSESVFNILSRLGFLRKSEGLTADPISQTTLVTAVALALCAIPAALESPFVALYSMDLPGWLALVWYGPFVTALAYVCWYEGIRRCEASMAAAFSGMMPLVALMLSITLLGERPGWPQLIGGALVVAGMLLSGAKGASRRLPNAQKLPENS